MAVRLGHAAVSWKDLGGLATRWLFSVRKAVGEPEGKTESQFAEEVSQVARNISWHHRAEVEVGPYLLDFAAVSKGDFEEEWDESKPGRSLARFCVAVEADGPTHFYRPHGSPYHWTSTSKFRHRLLSAMRIRVAHVPFYDWLQLEGLAQKEAYLTELLLKAHSTEFASLSIDKGAGVALTETSATSVASAMSGAGKKGSFIQRRVLARSRSDLIKKEAGAQEMGRPDAQRAREAETKQKRVDEHMRCACNLHAHAILMLRNVDLEEDGPSTVCKLLSSFAFLSMHHTFNLQDGLDIPEPELFEIYHRHRRHLIVWFEKRMEKKEPGASALHRRPYKNFNSVLQTVHEQFSALDAASSIDTAEFEWGSIGGDLHNAGRYCVVGLESQPETSRAPRGWS
eukprot:symbB.v1.2.020540.t1/scaffold1725.1/size121579/5